MKERLEEVFKGDTFLCLYFNDNIRKIPLCSIKDMSLNGEICYYVRDSVILTEKSYIIPCKDTFAMRVLNDYDRYE